MIKESQNIRLNYKFNKIIVQKNEILLIRWNFFADLFEYFYQVRFFSEDIIKLVSMLSKILQN